MVVAGLWQSRNSIQGDFKKLLFKSAPVYSIPHEIESDSSLLPFVVVVYFTSTMTTGLIFEKSKEKPCRFANYL